MCFALQKQLLKLAWPEKLLAVAQAEEVVDLDSGEVIFRGLRVRCGIHVGKVYSICTKDIRKAGIKYSGPAIKAAMKLASMAKAGKIVISAHVKSRLYDNGKSSNSNQIAKPVFLRTVELLIGDGPDMRSSTASFSMAAEGEAYRNRRGSDVLEEAHDSDSDEEIHGKKGSDRGKRKMNDPSDVESWLNSANGYTPK